MQDVAVAVAEAVAEADAVAVDEQEGVEELDGPGSVNANVQAVPGAVPLFKWFHE